jgi:hypothetical protein
MVGEACAHVQGESLKAYAALLTEASQLPDHQGGEGESVNPELRTVLALTCAVIVTCMALVGCSPVASPAPTANPTSSDSGFQPNNLTLAQRLVLAPYIFGNSLPHPCMIHHRHKWVENGVTTGGVPDTTFVGPDGNPQRLTPEQCQQENEKSLRAEEEAFQRTMAEARAVQQAQQKKEAAVVAEVVRSEEARGYKRVTVKELYIDGKAYADSQTKVSVFGFYKAFARHDERLYNSSDEYMMHTLNPGAYGGAEALRVGLLTEAASRNLRAAFLNSCEGGCRVRILGHVDHCVETSVFGRSSHDICLVAEDLGAQ